MSEIWIPERTFIVRLRSGRTKKIVASSYKASGGFVRFFKEYYWDGSYCSAARPDEVAAFPSNVVEYVEVD